jgi:polysaccharide export outer membrane protein
MKTMATLIAAMLVAAASGGSALARQAPEGTSPLAPLPTAQGAAPLDYRLGVGDVVQMIVFGAPEASARLRVRPDGTIEAPFVGAIQAVGKTSEELSALLRQGLMAAQVYRSPQVIVEVVQFQSQTVTILGFVRSPGVLTLTRTTRLSEVLAQAGGPNVGASDTIVINRVVNGEPTTLRASYDAIARNPQANDIVLVSGDQIFIPEGEYVFITGQITSPGRLEFREGKTVRELIGEAGGPSENGSLGRFRVTRVGEDGRSSRVRLKLDDKLKPGDIIEMQERLF